MCTHRGGLSAMSAGGNPTATAGQQAAPAARAQRQAVLDFTANEDHRSLARTAPRQVAAYLDAVNNGAFSKPRRTGSGDVIRTLTPDSANTGIKTGLRAHVINVYVSPSQSFRRAEITDKDGVSLGYQDQRSGGGLAGAEAAARKLLAIELRRRGIY